MRRLADTEMILEGDIIRYGSRAYVVTDSPDDVAGKRVNELERCDDGGYPVVMRDDGGVIARLRANLDALRKEVEGGS